LHNPKHCEETRTKVLEQAGSGQASARAALVQERAAKP